MDRRFIMNYIVKNLMKACLGENRDVFYLATLYGDNGSKVPVTFTENEHGLSAFSNKDNTLYSIVNVTGKTRLSDFRDNDVLVLTNAISEN